MSRKKILVIDDSIEILMWLKTILDIEGYSVQIAASGRVGEEKAHKYLPDLIISDVMMPAPNGFDLRRILSQDPETAHIPFIFITARTAGVDQIYAKEVLGAFDYITKPFTSSQLAKKVKLALATTNDEDTLKGAPANS
jgi:DNA-binding response OmpR family regulator